MKKLIMLGFIGFFAAFIGCKTKPPSGSPKDETGQMPSEREPYLASFYTGKKPYDASKKGVPQLNDVDMEYTWWYAHSDLSVTNTSIDQTQRVNGAIRIKTNAHEGTVLIKKGALLRHVSHSSDGRRIVVYGKDSTNTIVHVTYIMGKDGRMNPAPGQIINYKGKPYPLTGGSEGSYLDVDIIRDDKTDKATYLISGEEPETAPDNPGDQNYSDPNYNNQNNDYQNPQGQQNNDPASNPNQTKPSKKRHIPGTKPK